MLISFEERRTEIECKEPRSEGTGKGELTTVGIAALTAATGPRGRAAAKRPRPPTSAASSRGCAIRS